MMRSNGSTTARSAVQAPSEIADAFLLRILAGCSPLSAAEARSAAGWWQEERTGPEGFAAFLIRQGVLKKEAEHALHFMRQGTLAFTDGEHLFSPLGVAQVKEQCSRWQRRERVLSEDSAKSQRHSGEIAAGAVSSTFSQTERRSQAQLGPHVRKLAAFREQAALRLRVLGPGAVLGKCLLTAEVGRGGTGIVYRAYHQGLNVTVAVKVLQFDVLEEDPSVLEQLEFEARLLAQLNHPHVVRVMDFDQESNPPYLVMEYVEGLSLSELIQQSGRVRWDRATRMMVQVAQGLEAARQLGAVHRDVKPGNVLITRDGCAKLADLGLAVLVEDRGRAGATLQSPARDSMAGTVSYMAPEQSLSASGVDHRSDLYALGATFFHALTGQVPFRGRTRSEILRKHAKEIPVAPHVLVPELDLGISQIILRLLAKDPAQRYQDFPEFLAAIGSVQARTQVQLLPLPLGATNGHASHGLEGRFKPPSLWKSLLARLKP